MAKAKDTTEEVAPPSLPEDVAVRVHGDQAGGIHVEIQAPDGTHFTYWPPADTSPEDARKQAIAEYLVKHGG